MGTAEVESARRDLDPLVFAQEYEGIPAEDGSNPFGLDEKDPASKDDIVSASLKVPAGKPIKLIMHKVRRYEYIPPPPSR